MRLIVFLFGCLLTGCGRYADFTLPKVSGGDPRMTFVFEEWPEPVMTREGFSDVLNPSVVRDAPGSNGPGLSNFYSAFDGRTWHTGLATSADGLHWQRQRMLLSPDPHTWEGSYIAGNGTALVSQGQLWYWYVAGPKATRPNRPGEHPARPVLDYGPYMSWDERAVADPYVIRIGPYFYMYYLGQDRADPPRQRIGVARSADGVHWAEAACQPDPGIGRRRLVRRRRPRRACGLAIARLLLDALHGPRSAELPPPGAGALHRWRPLAKAGSGLQRARTNGIRKVICDPTVLVEGGRIRVWFGGGDAASPDEGLHGQIGYATLRPVHGTLAK